MSAIHDEYFTYALGVLCAIAVLGYGIRLATGAAPRSERVEGFGGSALLGKPIMTLSYWATDPIVRALVALGATANGVTWAALVFGLGAGVALGFGLFGLACLLATCSTVCDLLDGQVARVTGASSATGELLDAAIDRYTELAFGAGLLVYFRDSVGLMLLAFAALQACVMVPYASAKAEAMQIVVPNGLMRRHERASYLIIGVGLTSLFGDAVVRTWALPWASPTIAALAIVAVVGNGAALVRLVRIDRALRARP